MPDQLPARIVDYGDWGVTKLFGQNKFYLVIITSSVYGSVQAWLPDEIAMKVQSNWNTVLTNGLDALTSFVGNIITGSVPFAQYLTAQSWTGSMPLEVILPLHFFAVSSSTDEVVRPIRNLIRMALPRKRGGNNTLFGLIPPGPRVDPGQVSEHLPSAFKFNNEPDIINVYIGNFIRLKEVFISSLDQIAFKGKLSATVPGVDPGGLPMEGTCYVSFKTVYSLTQNDMMDILLPAGVGTTNPGEARPPPFLTE
jgi:hypothetical protein